MLTILSVAYPFAPVGPDAVGGAEQVLSALDRALVASGHRSIVLACEGSDVAGELVALPAPRGELDGDARAAMHALVRRALPCVTANLIHLHGIDFHAYLPPPGPPALATLHLPPGWYPPDALTPARPGTWLHCVSASQQRALDTLPHTAQTLPPIPNGVDTAALGATSRRRCGYAVMLGRVCPEKGQHVALDAAHLANIPLLIGGQVFPYPAHRRYFAERVTPLLDRRRRFLGPLGFAQKRRVLSGARCLLLPSTAPETSSLVAMEALACGTPVIAFRAGALPEIIDHGRTGFLVDSAAAMADAIPATRSIDPAVCQRTARERFDIARTTAAYLDAYQRLAA